MYESFYALNANPFRLVPDARFYYASSGHKRGLAYLRYGLHQGQGFVVVTGRPGTGKSTLVQTLFSELTDKQLIVASLTSTNLGATDILQAVGNSFDVYGEGSNKASLLIAIENFLKAKARQGKHVILIVDEAHNLPKASLEELRMLSNFQLGDKPLLQIMLLGQHQLPEILARPDMEQLSQRVIASCHLQPLNKDETRAYIGHRLQCVGWRGDPSISAEAVAVVYAASTGIPRLINVFCDRMLLAASLDGKHDIDLQLAKAVLTELQQEATGTFSSVVLDVNDLIGFEALPGDDFLLAPESLNLVEENSQANDGSNPRPASARVDEPVMAADDKSPAPAGSDDLDPGFINEPSSGSATDLAPSLDDSVAIRPQKAEPVEAHDFDVEYSTNQANPWKKIIAAIVFLVVILMFVVLFFLSENGKLPLDIRGDNSSAGIAMVQKQVIDIAPSAESLTAIDDASQTGLSSALLDAENIVVVAEQQQGLVEGDEVGIEKNSLNDADVIDTPVVIDNEAIEEFSPPEIRATAPQTTVKEAISVAKKETVPLKTGAPAVIKKVLAKKKTEQSKAVAASTISDAELSTLVVDLVSFYETGDVKKFSALFAKDAVANGMSGATKIGKDYKRLFLSTDKRQMRVDNMKWRHGAGKVSGRGVFAVSVWKKEGFEPLLQQGELNIELVRNKNKLLITNLSHELN